MLDWKKVDLTKAPAHVQEDWLIEYNRWIVGDIEQWNSPDFLISQFYWMPMVKVMFLEFLLPLLSISISPVPKNDHEDLSIYINFVCKYCFTGDTSLRDFYMCNNFGYKYLLLPFIILIFDIFSQIFQQSRVQSLPRKCCVLQPKTKRGEKNETAFCWQSNWGCSKTLQHRY